jgi:hypothetical protein
MFIHSKQLSDHSVLLWLFEQHNDNESSDIFRIVGTDVSHQFA